MSSDIVTESKRKPIVKGDTGTEIAANLILQGHRKNSALRRAITVYDACRR